MHINLKSKFLAMAGLLLSGLCLSSETSAEEAYPEVTTGSRTWSMADGSTRKLRFVAFGNRPNEVATFQSGSAPGGIPLTRFSAESRDFLEAIRDGRIKLLKTPGLSAEADFPTGPLLKQQIRAYRVGDLREWSHRNGRKVRGSMINLNDEVVSLLIGEQVWNLRLGDVSDADQLYLKEVKTGRARTVPLNVSFGGHSWDGGRERHITAKGHEVIGEPANDRRFEEARAKSIESVRAKLDEDHWEFHQLSESPIHKQPMIGWSFLAPPDPREIGPATVFYQATFRLTAEGRAKAAAIWPHSVTPKSWGGPPELVIDLAPNADLASIQPPTR